MPGWETRIPLGGIGRRRLTRVRAPATPDLRPSNIRQRLWDRGGEPRPAHLRNFPPKKLEASQPADAPPSRRAHRDGRGDRGPNTGDGPLAECPLLGEPDTP